MNKRCTYEAFYIENIPGKRFVENNPKDTLQKIPEMKIFILPLTRSFN